MKFLSVPENYTSSSPELNFDEFVADERWTAIADLLPDGIVVVDRKGCVCYINSAAESINEVSQSSVAGRPLSEFVARSRMNGNMLLEAFAEGSRINQIIEDSSGRRYVVSTRCARRWGGEINVFLIVQRNLDSLHKLNEASTQEPLGLAFTSSSQSENSFPGVEPVISGEATLALVERGLRAMAMGSRLLMLGESGVGKTELARLLHRRSGSPERPFVHVNCGSIPDSLFESEMFGYERGSFTGALSRGKKGLIEAAEGGTLFLDEVGEIPLQSQAKMLQVLEEGVVQRVGATTPRRLKIQIVAATNRDLRVLSDEGRFRRDLYYRLSVVTLNLPPLRQRRELVSLLLDRFISAVNKRRREPLKLDADCRRRLEGHDFPGNIRELQNIVEHLAVVCDQTATEANLPFIEYALSENVSAPSEDISAESLIAAGADLKSMVHQFELKVIQSAILKTGSKRKAADMLGVDIATIVRKSK
jgi:PAS domain S-box-containing protein